MLNQTITSILPLLELLQQPAFCIHDEQTIHSNAAARNLAPRNAAQLSDWLGSAAVLYASWERTSPLEISTQILGSTYSVTMQPLVDGTLFLLTEQPLNEITDAFLAVASQVLRQPLTQLSVLVQQSVQNPDPDQMQPRYAAMTRQIYQLSRITGNLADLPQLHNGTYRLHPEMKDIAAGLEPILTELESLSEISGRTFQWKLPTKPLMLQADFPLLERAILNLVSNAMKFATQGTPILLQAEEHGNYLLIRVRNQCTESRAELLRAAFSRLEQRNQIPDPRWGVGLGLPIAQYIARLHGGMVAVEATERGDVTVTMSILRRFQSKNPVLMSASLPFEYNGGMRRTLMELSEILPNHLFTKDAL